MGQLGFVDPAYQSAFSSPSGGSSQISSGTGSSSSGPVPNPITDSAYSQLLGLNQQNYGNVLGAYSQGQQQAGGQLPGIYGGYGQLGGDVQSTLGMGQVLGQNGNWGVAAPAAQAIGQAYDQQRANTTQQMTSAGLGNTTAVANAQNQNALGYGQAIGGLGAQLAQTAAGYQAQIGQAGLGARMQGLGMQTGLSGQEGGTLGSYRYANTAGALEGQASQATNKQTSTGGSFSGGGSNGGGLGSNPVNAYNQGAPTGFSGPSGGSPVGIGSGAYGSAGGAAAGGGASGAMGGGITGGGGAVGGSGGTNQITSGSYLPMGGNYSYGAPDGSGGITGGGGAVGGADNSYGALSTQGAMGGTGGATEPSNYAEGLDQGAKDLVSQFAQSGGTVPKNAAGKPLSPTIALSMQTGQPYISGWH